MYRYIWLVPLLPLAGAAINGLLGRKFRFPEKLIGGIAAGSIALSFLITLAAVYSYAFSSNAIFPETYVTSQDGNSFTWIPGGAVRLTLGAEERANSRLQNDAEKRRLDTGVSAPTGHAAESQEGSSLNVEWSYQLDSLSSIFMLIVTGVGLCIFIFATGYMHGDPGFYRFFAYMGLFMFSMLVLVMGSNFLMMFVGWEGVGLCSYLLIGYYFDKQEAANASRKAFITNRIGDFGFALAIFGVIATFGTAQYSDVFALARSYPLEPLGHWGLLSWIALGLFIGACGKSAQLPLHVWLPDAMAGPTPVSALIHAATMVTAGLYMVTRTNVIFQHSQTMMMVVALVGAATALFAATIGITQNDIKKVLAYSTVSQLGFMFMACGVGAFVIGIFHVMTHAFFKALMFLGAGSVIHGMHHEQDMRRMGGLRKYMPITYFTFMAGWLAICGIFPFSGFWSKDEILWNAAATRHIPVGWIVWIVGTIAATCTAFYMTRLMAMTFWGKEKFLEKSSHGSHADDHGHGHVPHESPRSMWVPLAVLAVLATIGGFVGITTAFTGGKHVGGRMNIVNFLDPIIWNPATHYFGTHEAVDSYGKPLAHVAVAHAELTNEELEPVAAPPPYGSEGFNLAHAVESKVHSETLTEWVFIIISLLVAGLGMFLGYLFYIKDTSLPDIWAARLRPLYQASYHKYWVDEFFGWAVTRRVMDAARGVFAFDSKVVDGGVNGTAWLTRFSSRVTGLTDQYFVDGIVNAIAAFVMRLMSPLFRAAQTGLTQNYALVMVLGLVAAVAVIFGADIMGWFRR
ncbi:MAG TPA: NADH-quinone oxidoreductase subunit L [Pyrinomonadaceae bacterium]|jgi:NADH-quinone oxidoreductase subunit L|nr:NADH-quinone oxidoreductase subunit L [Pyrinomonadaceae bacterium]